MKGRGRKEGRAIFVLEKRRRGTEGWPGDNSLEVKDAKRKRGKAKLFYASEVSFRAAVQSEGIQFTGRFGLGA